MLQFMCPSCKTVLQATEAQRGIVIQCPKCGQRLQTPGAPLAQPVASPPAPPPPADDFDFAAAPPAPQRAAAPQLSVSAPAPKKTAGPRPARWLIVGVGASLAAGLLIVAWLLLPKGASSTHAEVAPNKPAPRELTTEDIVARSDKSVCLIKSEKSSGTGFLIRPNVLATNAHVIRYVLVDHLNVYFPSAGELGKKPSKPRLLYYDRKRDLAFLSVPSELKPLPLADQYAFKGGQTVTVIGNPAVDDKLLLENAVSRGVMSSRSTIGKQSFYQLGISINPGNSGGPVFDSRGQVIGVVTLKAARQEGIAFCIPHDDLATALERVQAQKPEQVEQARSQHMLDVVFHRVSGAAGMYASAMRVYSAAMSKAQEEDRPIDEGIAVVRGMLQPRFTVANEYLVEDVKAAAAKVQRDTNLPEPTRKKITDLWNTYTEMKRSIDEPRGTSKTYAAKARELEERCQRQIDSLRHVLGLEDEGE